MKNFDIYMHSKVFLAEHKAGRITFGNASEPEINGRSVYVHDGLPEVGLFPPHSEVVLCLVLKEDWRARAMIEAGAAA